MQPEVSGSVTTALGRPAKRKRRLSSTGIAYIILLVMVAVTAILSPSFRSLQNFNNLVGQTLPLALVAFGETFVIVTAGVDLSVGAAMSFIVTVLSFTMVGPLGVAGSIALALAMGATIGLLNGLAVARLRLQPLIVTLGTMSIFQGLALQVRPTPGGSVPWQFMVALSQKVGPFVVPMLIWLVAAAVGIYLLRFTRFGHHVYAVGGDEQSAFLTGVRTGRIKLLAYTISGIAAAAAGIFMAARIGSGDPLVGQPYTLDAITAVVAGGTSLYGGRGTLLGTVAGVLIIGLLSNALNQLGVSSFYQYILKGAVLVAAVFLYSRQRKS